MKSILATTFIVAFFLFIYMYFAGDNSRRALEISQRGSDLSTAMVSTKVESNTNKGRKGSEDGRMPNPTDYMKENRASFNPPFDIEEGDYVSYSSEVLTQMAEAGDVTAMQFLGVKLLTKRRSEQDIKTGKEYLRNAIIYGSDYYPYVLLAEEESLYLRLSYKHGIDFSEAQRTKHLIETFSYYELARLMGNPNLANNFEKLFQEKYNIKPTEPEVTAIKAKATAMYASIMKERTALGFQ